MYVPCKQLKQNTRRKRGLTDRTTGTQTDGCEVQAVYGVDSQLAEGGIARAASPPCRSFLVACKQCIEDLIPPPLRLEHRVTPIRTRRRRVVLLLSCAAYGA